MVYFLGIDAGTTSMKAAIFDRKGRLAAMARLEYTLETPGPALVELDPEVYWVSCCQVVRQVVERAGIPPEEISSLCISSQGETFVAVDEDGRPTRRAIVWLDNRATAQVEAIRQKFDPDTIYQRTGQPDVAPTWPACKIMWIRENEPRIFERSRRFLLLDDYLLYRLTGQYVTSLGMQTSSLILDVISGEWWPEMMDLVGVGPERFGFLMPPGQLVGALTPAGAQALGLTTQTLAVTGSMDQTIGAVGSGNIRSNMVTETTGGALGIIYSVAQPVFDPLRRLPCYFHARAGHYALLPWGQTAGMALRWFRDVFYPGESLAALQAGQDPYDMLTAAAEIVPPGSDGLVVLPHLEGAFCPEFNPNAKGVFFGATLRHTRAHFVRAILESVAYMVKKNLEIVEQIGGPVREICCTGGAARSPLWLQIKADVLQQAVTTVDVEEAACLGAAMLGAVATDCFADLEEAAAEMVRVKERILPNPANAAVYRAGYTDYVELYERLAPMFHS